MQGLGKGTAWVNGQSIGRYWPSYLAEGNCSLDPCDYRGPYSADKCTSKCGEPTQRWFVYLLKIIPSLYILTV